VKILDAPCAPGAAADQESEGGALKPTARRECEAAPAGHWRSLMTLSAIIAVWPDLSVSVRRRIASETVDAMNWVNPAAEPPRRRDAVKRH